MRAPLPVNCGRTGNANAHAAAKVPAATAPRPAARRPRLPAVAHVTPTTVPARSAAPWIAGVVVAAVLAAGGYFLLGRSGDSGSATANKQPGAAATDKDTKDANPVKAVPRDPCRR